jgi:hypothetical protein
MMSLNMIRPSRLYGRTGKIGVGRTKFYQDIVYDRVKGGEQFVPGTSVPRLRLVRIGVKAVAAIDDEVDELIEGLRRERDRRPRTASRTGGGDA